MLLCPTASLLRASVSRMGSLSFASSSSSMAKRGALIVLEGLDRSGKSSQSSQLVSFLTNNGIPAESWRFPDRSTVIGNMISAFLSTTAELDDNTIHLLFSANRWEKKSLMESKLREGTTLVVDRYSFSGVAFSAAKGLDLNWCKAPERGLPAPDLVIYLNISAQMAAERGGYGAERYEKLDFQVEVAKQYGLLHDQTWQDIDASKSIDEVQEMIREASLKVISKCKEGKDLQHLWESQS